MENILAITQSVLALTPARWQNLVRDLPADLIRRKPAPGEWSALECLMHLLDTERGVFPARVQAFLAGRDFPAYNPDQQGTKPDPFQSAEALVVEFSGLRAQSLSTLSRLEPADLDRRARHSELGMVTLREMLHEWAGHDLMHTVQGERALMQPFILECGPWQRYFTDHLVETDA